MMVTATFRGSPMRHRFRGIALHLWTVDTTPFEQALGAAKEGGFDAVELRRVDFKRAEERGLSNTEILGRVRTNGLPVSAVGCEYGWAFAASEDRERLFASLEEACERAVTLDCATVMSGIGPGDASMEEGVANIRHAGEIVARHGLRLALEYQFQHPIVSRLDILRELIAKAGQRSVGLLLDAYHLQRGGASRARLRGSAGLGDLLCSIQRRAERAAQRGTAGRSPAAGPGRGALDRAVPAAGGQGLRGLGELRSAQSAHWAKPAVEVAREGAKAARRTLEIAFAG